MEDVDLASVARLLGDRSRATILTALIDGRALTVGELARAAGVGAPAASAHLGKLLDGGLVTVVAQGRHRYHRLAGPEIAQALEALANVSRAMPVRSLRASAAARSLRPARLCYDHLAGELGVRIHDHLVTTGAVVADPEGLRLGDAGLAWFAEAGVDISAVEGPSSPRPRLRPCLDWTERRHHLAGALAALLATSFLDRDIVRRRAPGERGLTVTPDGTRILAALLADRPLSSGP